ncbi:MAG: hypothetical protein GX185_04765 [Tissierellia bacterium]|nr:hypothetical protein [Tissierellia bacterium]
MSTKSNRERKILIKLLRYIESFDSLWFKRSSLDGLKVLVGKWYVFFILSLIISKARNYSTYLYQLSIYAVAVAFILVLGYSKRPYERKEKRSIFSKALDKLILDDRGADDYKSRKGHYVAKRPIIEKTRPRTIPNITVEQILEAMPSCFHVKNQIALNYKRLAQFEYLVIGPTGIFIVDVDNKNKQIIQDANLVSSLLLEEVYPISVISNTEQTLEFNRDYPTIRPTHLKTFMISLPEVYSTEEVEDLVRRIERHMVKQ